MELWKFSAHALTSMLARREVSATEVVRSHLDRVDEVDDRIMAFTEVMRERARADAHQSDARRRRGEARGALDGVPVSIKECFDIAGKTTTLGLPAWRSRVAAADAALVEALRGAGAVILGRTNLSQTMLYNEARNPLFGQTSNPWSLAHSPGGSSGGEAAAIASGMSPLGIGSDIGGSIRAPAHFCGICGFKPSLDRLPMRGYRSVLVGQEAVRGAAGPMARSVADLALVFESLDPVRLSSLDPRVAPVGWTEPDAAALRGTRVGVFDNDRVIAPSRSIGRALDRAALALREFGCEARPFAIPDIPGILGDYLAALTADGGDLARAALAGGPVDPVLEPLRWAASLPGNGRRAAAGLARALGQTSLALLLAAVGERSVSALWKVTDSLRAHRADLLAAMDREGVDVIVCPPYATPAFPHGGSKNFTLASSYSIVFNATQMPAGVVPVTRVRKDETVRVPGRDALDRRAAVIDARSEGMPVGVQVVGRPWKDHVVLAAMAAIEAGVSKDDGFPRTPVSPAAL